MAIKKILLTKFKVGKYRKKQNRPVIVRLTNRKVKTDIFKQRKKLRESNQTVFINEDLTKLNSQRLYRIKQHPAVMSGWSFQGKLYCKLLNLQVIGIEDGDLNKIDRVLLDSPNTDQLREQSQWRQDRGGGGGRGSRTRKQTGSRSQRWKVNRSQRQWIILQWQRPGTSRRPL